MYPAFAVIIGLDEGAIQVDRLFEGMVDIECAGISPIVAERAAIIGAEDGVTQDDLHPTRGDRVPYLH